MNMVFPSEHDDFPASHVSFSWTSTARFVSSKVCGDVHMKKNGLFECLASIEASILLHVKV